MEAEDSLIAILREGGLLLSLAEQVGKHFKRHRF